MRQKSSHLDVCFGHTKELGCNEFQKFNTLFMCLIFWGMQKAFDKKCRQVGNLAMGK